jgi:RNA polymerase sigma-70 factor (ECF subfamily)
LVERTNEAWLKDLSSTGERQEDALRDLGRIIRAGLPYALSSWLPASDPNFDALADDVVQETLLRVLDRLDSFEGHSKLSTWANKIAVRIALTELRRKRWQDRSLEEILEKAQNPQLIAEHKPNPERMAMQSDLLRHVQELIERELTEKQRTAMIALGVQGMPAEEVARRMGMTRNALYKLMHDARKRLKARLADEGLDMDDIMKAFEAR